FYGDFLYLHSFPTRRSSDLLYFWMQWYFPAVAWCFNSLFNYANGSIALSCRATFSRHEETDPGPGIVLSAGIVKRFRAKERSQRSEEHTSELQSLAYLVCRL